MPIDIKAVLFNLRVTMRYVLLILLLSASNLFGQKSENVKLPSIYVSFLITDYQTPGLIRQSSIGSVVKNGRWAGFKEMDPGFGLGYTKGLSPKTDLSLDMTGGFVSLANKNGSRDSIRSLLVSLGSTINFKLFDDKHRFSPFVSTGMHLMSGSGVTSLGIPLGIGIQGKILRETFILLNARYTLSTIKKTDNFSLTLALVGAIVKRKTKAPEKRIVNSSPLSIETAVPAIVKDERIDSDKDGIYDEEDRCPFLAGIERYAGCPIPDRDKDGLNDEQDRCPDSAGPRSNFGCPLQSQGYADNIHHIVTQLATAASNIHFETGKAILLSSSIKNLDSILILLGTNPGVRMSIEGHTDNQGSTEENLKLSRERANTVLDYFLSHGINRTRLKANGYGESKPVASNDSSVGRASNRRVELKIF